MVTKILFVVLAAGFANGAVGTLRQASPYAEIMERVGVGRRSAIAIAGLELAAAAGLLAGLVQPALGALAAGGLVLLTIGAVGFHLRVSDPRGAAVPAALGALSAVALLLAVTG